MTTLKKFGENKSTKDLPRAVIDTNIVVRAFLLHPQKPKSPARRMIQSFLTRQSFIWLWSEDILNEYKNTLDSISLRKDILKHGYKVDLDLGQMFTNSLSLLGEKVEITVHSLREARRQISDLDDSHFLALAIDGKANVITTGDSDIYKLGSTYSGIEILSLQQFLRRIAV